MAVAVTTGGLSAAPQWGRKYPPLLALGAAFLIALAVLPSALNLPQTNPTQTLEYAPVPPTDEDIPPPPAGNFSSLGLGGSSTLEEGAPPPGEEEDPNSLLGTEPPPIIGKTPSTKRCVGNPPRQTEDPSSPPCAANFQGDNFGATYQGVTKEEIRILIYEEGNTNYLGSSQGSEVTPDGEYFDLGQPPKDDDHIVVRSLRAWQNYFNDRFQTYGRTARFFVYFSGSDDSVEQTRSDAADNFNKIKPFAVINFNSNNADAYLEFMAKRGVLNFGSFVGRDASFFSRFPKLIWGYFPSLENQAEQYSSYVCTKVKPFPTSYNGNPALNGSPRKFGLWYTADATKAPLRKLKDAIKERMRSKCNITDADLVEHTFPEAGFTASSRYAPTYATRAVADYQSKGVTTLLWIGGLETNLGREAARAGWLPEMVNAGDRDFENSGFGDDQQQQFWEQAVFVTNVPLFTRVQEELCFQAYRDADPEAPQGDISFIACRYYTDIRQLFVGIQVAGPRLGPSSIDKGYRAIPSIRSTDPKTPACFFIPGDYTCVKDATILDWDSGRGGETPNAGPCYRTYEGGARYLANGWPAGDVIKQKKGAADICNNYSTGTGSLTNPATPNRNDPDGGPN